MEADGAGERQDDLLIEVTDLQPAAPNTPSSWLSRRRWASRAAVSHPLLALAAAALVVLVVVAALPLGARPTPAPTPTRSVAPNRQIIAGSPTPSPYPTPTRVAPQIGFAPLDCPLASAPVAFDPAAVGSGIGGSNVWLVAPFSGRKAVLHLNWLLPSGYTQYGWPVPIQVLVKPDFAQPITLNGSDLRTRYPLWLAASPYAPAAPSITLEPEQLPSSTSDQLWSIWFGIMYLPGAGCYMWQASWPGDGWTATFAAGE